MPAHLRCELAHIFTGPMATQSTPNQLIKPIASRCATENKKNGRSIDIHSITVHSPTQAHGKSTKFSMIDLKRLLSSRLDRAWNFFAESGGPLKRLPNSLEFGSVISLRYPPA